MTIDWWVSFLLMRSGKVPNFWPYTWQEVVPGHRLYAYEVRLPEGHPGSR